MSDGLPHRWITVSLETLAASTKYPIGDGDHGQIKPGMYSVDGVPYIRVGDMGWGKFAPSGLVYIPLFIHEQNLKSDLRPGDVLIAKTGATIGKCCIVPKSIPHANTSSSVGKVTVDRMLTMPEWILWYFLSREFKEKMWEVSQKTAQPGFNIRDLKKFAIPLAPLSEQQRIVSKLEALSARIDACQTRLAKIPILLKRFRQSVLAAACSGKLTEDWREEHPKEESALSLISRIEFKLAEPEIALQELPEKWEWVALGNYGRCSRGRFSIRPRNDPSYFGGEHPFIQIGDLPVEGGWILAHKQTLNAQGLAVSKKFPRGTVVIAIVGATIGNTGLLGYDMCFPDSMVGIETGTVEGNHFIELYLRQQKHVIRQASYSSGGQPNIKLESLNPYPLPLPPLSEQREIVRRVESLFAFADQLEVRYRKAQEYVDKLTPSLLAKAFRGELVPQDPNDEPAAILLERIRNAREVSGTTVVRGQKGVKERSKKKATRLVKVRE